MPNRNIRQAKIKENDSFYFNLFGCGLLCFSVGVILYTSNYLNVKSSQIIQGVGILLLIIGAFNLIKFKIEPGYLRTIFILYLFWSLIIISRTNYPLNFDLIKIFLFGGGTGGLIYLIPLIIFFPVSLKTYKKVFDIILVFALVYLLCDIVFFKKLFGSSGYLKNEGMAEVLSGIGLPSGFILLTYLYHSNKINIIALTTLLLTLLFAIIGGRRGIVLITSSILFYSFLVYFFNGKKKLLIVYFSILIISVGTLMASSIYKIKQNRILGFISERGMDDTRTGVELSFYDDMKFDDWIVGRGMTGEYFCPNIEENQLTNFRNVIETGYLQIILKGGIISLVLLLLITIPGTILGIFFSKNILSKAAGAWVLQFMFNLYLQVAVNFSLSYFLVWISIGICFSKKIRNMRDSEIQNKFLLLK